MPAVRFTEGEPRDRRDGCRQRLQEREGEQLDTARRALDLQRRELMLDDVRRMAMSNNSLMCKGTHNSPETDETDAKNLRGVFGGIRTRDPLIKSQVLCRLSYEDSIGAGCRVRTRDLVGTRHPLCQSELIRPVESGEGVEPSDGGFADRCVRPLRIPDTCLRKRWDSNPRTPRRDRRFSGPLP